MWKFVLRNNNKKKGKVLATVYNTEVLKSAIMSIEEKIFNGQIKVSSEDFIDLERNNNYIEKTIYTGYDNEFSAFDFREMEQKIDEIIRKVRKGGD